MQKEIKKKKLAPIRTQFILALAVFCSCVFLYFTLFFAGHMKSLIEWGGRKAFYSEVNLDELNISFLQLSVQMKKLQVTNFNQPDYNLVQFDEMNFQLSLDALLRAKILIEEASLRGVVLAEKRKRRGRVYPQLKKQAEQKENVLLAHASDELTATWEEKSAENVLADLFTLLTGGVADFNKDDLAIDLKSQEKVQELSQQLKVQQEQWQQSLDLRSQLSSWQSIRSEYQGKKFSNDPKTLAREVKEFQSQYKTIKSEIRSAQSQLDSQLASAKDFSQRVGQIDDWIKEDIESAKAYLKIPSLNLSQLTQDLLSGTLQKILEPYLALGQKILAYAPERGGEGPKKISPPPRGEGVSITFPQKNAYPLFWLRLAEITARQSSEVEAGASVGGAIKDLSTDQFVTDLPWQIQFEADLPAKELRGLFFNSTIDMRESENFIALTGQVDSFNLKELNLSENPKLSLALNQSRGKITAEGLLKAKENRLSVRSDFDQASWRVSSEQKNVQTIMSRIFEPIDQFDLTLTLSGRLLRPSLAIRSSLDQQLQRGLRTQLQEKMQQAQQKVESAVREKIAQTLQPFRNSYQQAQQKYLKPLQGHQEQLASLNTQFDQLKNQIERKQKDQAKSQKQEAVDQLKDKARRKLGF